jgi:putative transposase
MCAVLEISKRTYYKYRSCDDHDYLDYLMIKNIFNKSKGTYGYRRITEGLKIEYGVIYNHKKVARIMKKYYLKPEYVKRIRQTIYKRIEENVQPNIIKRNFKADKPNQKWTTDITYLIFGKAKDYIYQQY